MRGSPAFTIFCRFCTSLPLGISGVLEPVAIEERKFRVLKRNKHKFSWLTASLAVWTSHQLTFR